MKISNTAQHMMRTYEDTETVYKCSSYWESPVFSS